MACKPLLIIGLLELLAGFAPAEICAQSERGRLFSVRNRAVVLLAGCIWIRNEPVTPRLQKLGWLAFVLVQLQGLLGGLRVVLFWDEIGIFHAAFGTDVLRAALRDNSFYQSLVGEPAGGEKSEVDHGGLRRVLLFTTVLIFAQLVLGATMRHQHAGLAISDFPLAHHKLWPSLDANSIAVYNSERVEIAAVQSHHGHADSSTNGASPDRAADSGFRDSLRAVHVAATGRGTSLDEALAGLGGLDCGAKSFWARPPSGPTKRRISPRARRDGSPLLVNGALLTIISFRVLIPVRAMASAGIESLHRRIHPANRPLPAPNKNLKATAQPI